MAKQQTKKTVEKGKIYITATFNNTMVTITDDTGHPIVVGSTGMHGFSGTRKSTPHAATVTMDAALRKAVDSFGLIRVDIFIKGIGPGREAALRAVRTTDID